jgi:hypothetical protein
MRRGYSPFTHRTLVCRPSGGCQTSTISMLASFQRYRAETSVAPGSNGRTLAGSWSVAHAGGLGPRSEGPHGAYCSRLRTDCRLKGFHFARSHSSSQDCRCTVRTASSWSTLRRALRLIVVWPARWGPADAHSCFGAARFGLIDRSVVCRLQVIRLQAEILLRRRNPRIVDPHPSPPCCQSKETRRSLSKWIFWDQAAKPAEQ